MKKQPNPVHSLPLHAILYSQGFGTRRICAGLIQQGLVTVARAVVLDASAEFDVAQPLAFTVQGVAWDFHEKAVLMLHKPAGYECSQKPSSYPSIYTLLPAPIRQRGGGAAAGVQAVGRLDQDTTGLLLLTDDGRLIHRLSSPKHHVPKVYEVTAKHPVSSTQIEKLLSGVVLDDDPKPVRAAACVQTGESTFSLTITEGKYHQVKRMVAAVGNRVIDTGGGLHRSRIGELPLPADLQSGQWRWLDADDMARVGGV